LTVGEPELSEVLDLVQEDDLAVGHETSVHSRDTRATRKPQGARPFRPRGRARSGNRDDRAVQARARLATITAVRGGVSAVTVHAAARTLRPVAANHVLELGTARSISGRDTRVRIGLQCGLTKHGLAGGSSGFIGGDGGLRVAIRAAVLAAILNKAVAVSIAAVTISRAAAAVRAVGLASGTAEFPAAATIRARSGSVSSRLRLSGERSGLGVGAGAAELAAIGRKAVSGRVSAEAVLAAASAKGAIGITAGTAELLSATPIRARCGSRGSRANYGGFSRGRGLVVAARDASGATMSGRVSAPAVLTAARAGVHPAVGVAERVAVERAARAVERVVVLPLLDDGDDRAVRLGLGPEIAVAEISDTLVVGRAGLALQAMVRFDRVDVTSRVDPVEFDVCRRQTREGGDREERSPHTFLG